LILPQVHITLGKGSEIRRFRHSGKYNGGGQADARACFLTTEKAVLRLGGTKSPLKRVERPADIMLASRDAAATMM
jgi:hypothetical protein